MTIGADGPGSSRLRRVVARALVILGIVLGLVSIHANFVRREALDEAAFRRTSSELVANEIVRNQVAATTVDLLYENVDVGAELSAKLPEQYKGLAGPIAGVSRQLVDRAAVEALQRPAVQGLFVDSASVAQRELVDVLEGDTRALDTTGGAVVLDLRPIVLRLGDRFGFVANLEERVPADAARVTILRSDQLKTAQDATQLLKVIGDWTWLPMVAAWVLAVWLVPGRRLQELRAIAIGFIVGGLVVVAVRHLAGNYLVDNIVVNESVRPSAREVWSILTDPLAAIGWLVAATGVLASVGLWLYGGEGRAATARGWLAPLLVRPVAAWGSLALLLFVFFWAAPPTRFTFFLIVTVPALVGFELLRRKTRREHPDAQAPDLVAAVRAWRTTREPHAAPAPVSPAAPSPTTPTEELERLTSLHTTGALTDDEFHSAKALVLGRS